MWVHILTRAVLGRGRFHAPPLRLFANISKTVTPIHTSFPHMSWKFQTAVRSLKVRSPSHVKWPHLRKKVWMLVITTLNARLPWNFQRLLSVPRSIKCKSRTLDIGDQKSGQFCVLSIISQGLRNRVSRVSTCSPWKSEGWAKYPFCSPWIVEWKSRGRGVPSPNIHKDFKKKAPDAR